MLIDNYIKKLKKRKNKNSDDNKYSKTNKK